MLIKWKFTFKTKKTIKFKKMGILLKEKDKIKLKEEGFQKSNLRVSNFD